MSSRQDARKIRGSVRVNNGYWYWEGRLPGEERRRFGLEATRAVLGHSCGAKVTDRYSFAAAEDDTIRIAAPAVEALG